MEETVKSPLDPAAPAEAVEASGQEAMEAKTVFTKDELDARLRAMAKAGGLGPARSL